MLRVTATGREDLVQSCVYHAVYLLGGVLLEFGEEEGNKMNSQHLDVQTHTTMKNLPAG